MSLFQRLKPFRESYHMFHVRSVTNSLLDSKSGVNLLRMTLDQKGLRLKLVTLAYRKSRVRCVQTVVWVSKNLQKKIRVVPSQLRVHLTTLAHSTLPVRRRSFLEILWSWNFHRKREELGNTVLWRGRPIICNLNNKNLKN